MANFFNKLKDYIRGDGYYDEDEYDEEYEDYEDEAEEQPVRSFRNISSSRNSNVQSIRKSYSGYNKVVNINTSVNMQVVVSSPASLEDASDICMDLKDKKTIIVNLENVEYDTAQRISDFLCGACYALDGSIQLISDEIFIVGPVNVNITGQFKEDLKANGIKLPYTNSRNR